MPENTTKVWELSQENGVVELHLPEATSLDAITRQLPQGFYTTFRTFADGQRVLGLRAHLERLYGPAETEGIFPSAPVKVLRQNLAELLQTFPGEARVRLMMSSEGQFYIAIEPLKLLSPEIYSRGVEVVTSDVERQNPRLKSTAFISASRDARVKLAESRAFEALLVRHGHILEGMTSNFFYIKDGILGTAREDILLGVTRRMVLRVARGSGLEILYKPLKRELVPVLNEAFLTSSSRGIVPIVKIDAHTVGEGVPGKITRMLRDQYNAYVETHAEQLI